MDVVSYTIALGVSSMGWTEEYPANEPGLELTVMLRCRVCQSDHQASYAHPVRPRFINDNNKPEPDRSYSENKSSWFKFAIDSRISVQRSCSECGTMSVIPAKQQAALIAEADSWVTAEWLRESVEKMGLVAKRVPETYRFNALDVYEQKASKIKRIVGVERAFALQSV
jgi:hypothetical protein